MVYNREDWIAPSTNSQRPYPTRPDGYKDFEYSSEQHYGRRSNRKIKEWHFNDDGSVTLVYSDGSIEIDSPKNKGSIQYSRKPTGTDAATYTEAQYRDFGWVRDTDVISSGAWEDFTSKFAAAL